MIYLIYTMKFNIHAFPSTPLKGKGIDDISDSSITVGTIVKNIKETYPDLPSSKDEDASLILLQSEAFSRIMDTDPMCMWYGGAEGDIMRVTGNTGIRYRKVARAPAESASKKEKQNPDKFSEASVTLYTKAYGSVIDMIADRQGDNSNPDLLESIRAPPDVITNRFNNNNLPSLDIGFDEVILSRSGRRIFVFFLKHAVSIKENPMLGSHKDYDTAILDKVRVCVNEYNKTAAKKLKEPSSIDEVRSSVYAEHFEIIIVYNNQHNAVPVFIKTNSMFPYITAFAAQQIPMSLSRHCEQPEFQLMTAKLEGDRRELREMYTMHGVLLDNSKTIEEMSLKAGSKFVFI
jgi:hypothetical protein